MVVETSDKLKQDIGSYLREAEVFEQMRESLVDEINGIVRDEIAARVEVLLPKDYGINRELSRVMRFHGVREEVPKHFDVDLRLTYQGSPITITCPESRNVWVVQRDLRHSLDAIAQEYGLTRIDVVREPIR